MVYICVSNVIDMFFFILECVFFVKSKKALGFSTDNGTYVSSARLCVISTNVLSSI